MFDTHAHINLPQFDQDRGDVVGRCRSLLAGVINVGIDLETSNQSVELAKQNKFIFAAVGIHPEVVGLDSRQIDVNAIRDLVLSARSYTARPETVVAIGEIGLDYFHTSDEGLHRLQKQFFAEQLKIAQQLGLPIIIHSREAFADTITVLKENISTGKVTGVWHSFTGTYAQAEEVISLGLKIGVNGIATYSSAVDLQAAIAQLKISNILLETDSPFLSPVPLRGKRNEPVNVRYVADKVADLQGREVDVVLEQTDCNVTELFQIEL